MATLMSCCFFVTVRDTMHCEGTNKGGIYTLSLKKGLSSQLIFILLTGSVNTTFFFNCIITVLPVLRKQTNDLDTKKMRKHL